MTSMVVSLENVELREIEFDLLDCTESSFKVSGVYKE